MSKEMSKEQFIEILSGTGRKGIDQVLAKLEETGFYEAPASTRFHGCYPGGLLEHSLCVYDEAVVIREAQLRLKPEVADSLPPDSIAIAALLHDVCKAEVYRQEEKRRKNAAGMWESYNGSAFQTTFTVFAIVTTGRRI